MPSLGLLELVDIPGLDDSRPFANYNIARVTRCAACSSWPSLG